MKSTKPLTMSNANLTQTDANSKHTGQANIICGECKKPVTTNNLNTTHAHCSMGSANQM